MGVKKQREIDPNTFLATIGEGRKIVPFAKKQTIFAQGDAADALFYIQSGKVKVTVVSNNGKEATIGILSQRDFFWRRLPRRSAAPHGRCHGNDRWRASAH